MFRLEHKDGRKFDVIGLEVKFQENFGPSLWGFQEKAQRTFPLEEIVFIEYRGEDEQYEELTKKLRKVLK